MHIQIRVGFESPLDVKEVLCDYVALSRKYQFLVKSLHFLLHFDKNKVFLLLAGGVGEFL